MLFQLLLSPESGDALDGEDGNLRFFPQYPFLGYTDLEEVFISPEEFPLDLDGLLGSRYEGGYRLSDIAFNYAHVTSAIIPA